MHLSFTVPNPLARLTGLLEVLERARTSADSCDCDKDQSKAVDQQDGPREEFPADHHDDLESLSLSRCGPSLEPASHDLAALSLSRVEETPTGRSDGLSDASLSRNIPRRPRPRR
jgi:hypothetical protein